MHKLDIEQKNFHTVKFFREIKGKISQETQHMSFIEFKEYINKRTLKHINSNSSPKKTYG